MQRPPDWGAVGRMSTRDDLLQRHGRADGHAQHVRGYEIAPLRIHAVARFQAATQATRQAESVPARDTDTRNPDRLRNATGDTEQVKVRADRAVPMIAEGVIDARVELRRED